MTARCADSSTYQRGCRCSACQAYSRRSRELTRHRAELRARGVEFPGDLLPAGETRSLLKRAMKRGLTQTEITRLTGVTRPTLWRILNGHPTVRRSTANTLHRVLVDDENRHIRPGTRVPTVRPRHIIRCLEAQGWSLDHLEEIIENNLGVSGSCIDSPLRQDRKTITAVNAKKIDWLYENIGDRVGPSKSLITKMMNRGFFPSKHYNANGEILVSTLSPEQRDALARVR